MKRWWSTSFVVLWATQVNVSCLPADPFECTIDAQCGAQVEGAQCQSTGFCSFPDEACSSGQRYGELAGMGLAGQCVEQEGGSTGPTIDPEASGTTATSAADSSGSGTSEPGTGTTAGPECGAVGQPCCEGICDAEATCTDGSCEPCVLLLDVDEYYSCATRADGITACWGSDDFGQLGDGPTAHPGGSSEPVVLDGVLGYLDLGAFHGCGTGPDGLLCWGRNGSGQLGLGSTYEQQPSPVGVGLMGEVVDLAGGSFHTCALTATGEVWCWGANGDGQLGEPMMGSSDVPVPLTMLGDVVDVAAGAFHTCVLDATGTVTCWGRNDVGELGAEGPVEPGQRVEVVGLPPARALTLGDFHGCIITEGTDEVWCWGANGFGQTGEGAVGDVAAPHLVPGVTAVQSIDAGDDHTCVITPEGAACWGNNVAGQLGTPGDMSTPVPLFVEIEGVTRIRGGREHTCVVTDEPAIQCFGRNGDGQLGDGTFVGGPTPVTALFGCGYQPQG
ncbi:MAG: hypothetical protein AB1Z98_16680 [Nannocystaceae bacterium]